MFQVDIVGDRVAITHKGYYSSMLYEDQISHIIFDSEAEREKLLLFVMKNGDKFHFDLCLNETGYTRNKILEGYLKLLKDIKKSKNKILEKELKSNEVNVNNVNNQNPIIQKDELLILITAVLNSLKQ